MSHTDTDVQTDTQSTEQPDINKPLIVFLDSIVTQLKRNQLSNEQIFLISEFMMKYNFIQSQSDTDETIDDDARSAERSDNTELLKFLSLGFHIYKNILNSTDSDSDEDED
jgi:hypothetical protein